MKTVFDKIYVLSLITNRDRQEFIKHQMKELNIDYEFIYTIDYKKIKYDNLGNEIKYPVFFPDFDFLDDIAAYGCALAHYQAIFQAYEFGYNNVLVLEDDICFIKDKTIIENYLNNVPKDADFITYAPRLIDYDEYIRYNTEYSNQNDFGYVLIPNDYTSLCGAMMYGIMNRNIMKMYIDNQEKQLNSGDHIEGIFENPSIKRYASKEAICIDQYNRIIQQHEMTYLRCYQQLNKFFDYEDYYKPFKYDGSNINRLINDCNFDNLTIVNH
jgi:hypothetical protein